MRHVRIIALSLTLWASFAGCSASRKGSFTGIPASTPSSSASSMAANVPGTTAQAQSPTDSPTTLTASAAVLRAEVVPPPSGFLPATGSDFHNGPITPANFDKTFQNSGAAADAHFLSGYDQAYSDSQLPDILEVILLQFATHPDAANFANTISVDGAGYKMDPIIPNGKDFDTHSNTGASQHGVIAVIGNLIMMVTDFGDDTRPVFVDDTARQQYAGLS